MTNITHRRIWAISWPILLSNATIPILGAIDTAVVGQMGTAAPIGAVGLGAIILASVYWIFGFLRMGTSGLAAQAHGAGTRAERAAILYRALLIGLVAGVAIVVLQWPLLWSAFRLAPASDEVEALARDYLTIRIWGAPWTIALYAINGWLIALERSKGVLWLQLWINGVNALLDCWFVLGLGWGVGGVASATLIAEMTGFGLGIYLCRDAFGYVRPAALARLRDRAALKKMMSVNGVIMLRTVLLQAAFTAFLFLGSGLGDVPLAANQILMQFLSIAAYALDGFAFAAETLIGQAIGARDGHSMDRAARLSFQWSIGGSVLIGCGYFLFGPMVIDLMTAAPDVRATAKELLIWAALAPVIGIAGWMYDGFFIGATLTRAMLRSVAWSVLVYVLALVTLLPDYGNAGLWASLMMMNAARGLLGWWIWAGGRATFTA